MMQTVASHDFRVHSGKGKYRILTWLQKQYMGAAV